MPLPREMTPAAVRKWRAYAEDLIERAITILDELDGDPDFEPSLADTTTDLEMDDADLEPSLGWTVSGALGSCASWLSVDPEDGPADGPELDPSEFECWDVPLYLDTAPLP